MDSRSCSSEIHLGYDIHTRPQLQVSIFSRCDNDFYRDPLDDLDVISCRVFGRKQAEQRAGRSRDAVNPAAVSLAIGHHVNHRTLSRTYVAELRLFEVSGDPYVLERNQREQLLT